MSADFELVPRSELTNVLQLHRKVCLLCDRDLLPLIHILAYVTAGSQKILQHVLCQRSFVSRIRLKICNLQVINEAQPDVLLLMEVDQNWFKAFSTLNQSMPFQLKRARSDNFGIALFSRFSLSGKIETIGPAQVPSIRGLIDVRGTTVQIWGTHPPPPMGATLSRWRNEQLTEIAQRLSNQPLTIMAGDLNNTPYSRTFGYLLQNSGLQDASKGFGHQGTWPMSLNVLSIPIDHVLHSKDIGIRNTQVLWGTGSDHAAIVVDLKIPIIHAGEG